MILNLTRNEKLALVIITAGSLTALYLGWRWMWFLTDDAFIAFRYISNSLLGFGYVWNAPPFRPVEGYTSFLWVFFLDIVWRISGIYPPRAANSISLIFSGLTLLLGAVMVLRTLSQGRLRLYRVHILALVMIGTLTNRTFLTWTSSGLETAMFNFFVTLWVFSVIFLPAGTNIRIFSTSFSTALIYLIRPDGILTTLATMLLAAYDLLLIFRRQKKILLSLLCLLPLLLVPAHFIWRKLTYGEWLSNTYFAKTVSGRLGLESGWRYLLSFVIEYSLWIWLAIFVIYAVYKLNHFVRLRRRADFTPANYTSPAVVILTLLFHFLYYTFVIGGDYFEYRVYSHLILLLFVALATMLNQFEWSFGFSFAVLTFAILLALPIPWLHWMAARDVTTKDQFIKLELSVASQLARSVPNHPLPIVQYLQFYDDLQFWLIDHYICVRQQELKLLANSLLELYPSRQQGALVSDDSYPVVTQIGVGVLGWVLPDANVIDLVGLNDYVIARNPNLRPGMRMAHERQPPQGYVECFDPNIRFPGAKFVVVPRKEPLTAEKIIWCEQYYANLIANPGK